MTEDLFEIARKQFFGEATPNPNAPPAERFTTSHPSPALSSDKHDDSQAGTHSSASGARAEEQQR
jgi:hypothetical protein